MPRKTESYYKEKYNTLKLYYDSKVHIKEKFSAATLLKLADEHDYIPNTFAAIKPANLTQVEDSTFTGHLRMFMARNCNSKTDWGHLKVQASELVEKILKETNYVRISNCEQTTRKSIDTTNISGKKSGICFSLDWYIHVKNC